MTTPLKEDPAIYGAPTPPHTSETSKHRHEFLGHIPKCNVLDIGYGGDPVVPWAVCCDLPQGSYTNVGDAPQQLGFSCLSLPFKDQTLDAVFSSHVIEDFSFPRQVEIFSEWKRCLRSGGRICLLLPDQKRYEAHCKETGQPLNDAHIEPNMGLAAFKNNVWTQVRGDMIWVEGRDLNDYSFMVIVKKL